jgi:PAS domain S-box-containing protein
MTSEELLGLALSQELEHALILLDANARVVGWYAGATNVLGYSADEMLGQPLDRIFTPEDLARGELALELKSAAAYGKSEDDRWHVRKDGIRIWVSGIVTALRDAAGELVGFTKIMRDRTDLRGHVSTLENRLALAAAGDEQRHTVLGTLAHELRNPLGPLVNAAHLIQLAVSDKPEVTYSVKVIQRQVQFIDQLVKDLLELTRVNVGKVQPHFRRTTLRSITDNAIETCSAALGEKKQTARVFMPDEVPLNADPVRLQQVLVNLISNSSKFSPPGATIWIKATVDGNHVVIRVEDRGQGIPTELLPRIFDLFTQAGSEENVGTSHGLGLGLALVKSFVEMHHGTVQARSEGAGKGAEIIVRLPLTQSPGPTDGERSDAT